MRTLVFDEVSSEDLVKARAYFQEELIQSRLSDVFILKMPFELLSLKQKNHLKSCGPYEVILLLEKNSICLELLVRAKNTLRCDCVGYVTEKQLKYCLDFMDVFFNETHVCT